jgi:hypothetical protein
MVGHGVHGIRHKLPWRQIGRHDEMKPVGLLPVATCVGRVEHLDANVGTGCGVRAQRAL